MATERKDPLPVYCFEVKLNGLDAEASMYFKTVSGLKSETEVADFQEGGQNMYAHRLVGVTKWSNLVLKRGFSRSKVLVEWREEWLKPGAVKTRKSGELVQLDTQLKRVCSWEFQDGWPCKWELSEFDASKSELAIETLEIAHHGLKFKP